MAAKSKNIRQSNKAAVADAARRSKGAYDRFLALSDSEKTREAENLANLDALRHARPLNAAEQKLWNKVKSRLGRQI
jgi:hypothetical protein